MQYVLIILQAGCLLLIVIQFLLLHRLVLVLPHHRHPHIAIVGRLQLAILVWLLLENNPRLATNPLIIRLPILLVTVLHL